MILGFALVLGERQTLQKRKMSGQRITASELLSWSVINSQTEREDTTRPTINPESIDPKWIEILLGKPDCARMLELIKAASDTSKSTANRILALDEMELLVESLDNSNDLQPLKIWPELLLLTADSVPEIRAHSLWYFINNLGL